MVAPRAVTRAILALNAGSSSLKFGLFECSAEDELTTLARGVLRPGDGAVMRVEFTGSAGEPLLKEEWPASTVGSAVERLLDWIKTSFTQAELAAVGHRVVHGGADFADPVLIDDSILASLEALVPLAPLHQPACLEPVHDVARLRPDVRQVACFDTTFHRTMRPPQSRYALPRSYEAEGIRHYGFHGLSFESIAAQLTEEAAAGANAATSRVIVAHLGNGASLCAMQDLKSVDTTMGFSALDGLVMGTRPGSLDPGILLYLVKEKGYSAKRLERLLYRESGLLGASGISGDVATLLASHSSAAVEALELFAFSVARHTAALAATLSGLDRFIFTGGIGENAPAIRAMIVGRLGWLGAELDDTANEAGASTISTEVSSVLIERRSTNEELAIALGVSRALLFGG